MWGLETPRYLDQLIKGIVWEYWSLYFSQMSVLYNWPLLVQNNVLIGNVLFRFEYSTPDHGILTLLRSVCFLGIALQMVKFGVGLFFHTISMLWSEHHLLTIFLKQRTVGVLNCYTSSCLYYRCIHFVSRMIRFGCSWNETWKL